MECSTWDLGSGSNVDRGFISKNHFGFTLPQSGSELRAVLGRCCVKVPQENVRDSATCPIRFFLLSLVRFTTCSVRAVWSSHETTLNPTSLDTDRGDPDPVNPVSVPLWRAQCYLHYTLLNQKKSYYLRQ